MPTTDRTPGSHPLSNAERQARYRARRAAGAQQAAVARARPAKRHSRPRRWREAVAELVALQAEYAAWLAALPDGLQHSATADALQAIVDLDLDTIACTEPPRGYGRD